MKHHFRNSSFVTLIGVLLVFAGCSETTDQQISEEDDRLYYEHAKSQDEINETESGLLYEVVVPAEGPSADSEQTVLRFEIVGRLVNQTIFLSSYEQNDTAEMPIECIGAGGQVNSGLIEGLLMMEEGSSYRFILPSELGYGENGNHSAGIHPGATLIYEIDLLEIVAEEGDCPGLDE